ncbi:MFS transporter|uniref:MFS transporter n=1 Tax=Pseudomonas sp. SbOxS1 TaxID=2723884 RepID=UPI0015D11FCF|nr:MFS transporter [Pseudomonas sp. SbOxS1]NYU03328.1 MFS transporter [Pseudomonas sp. SbOxS1]
MSENIKRRKVVIALLLVVMIISALDKTIFAFAGAQIIDELALTPEQFGLVGSSFFFFYSLSGVLVGFLANRAPTRWILTGMSLVWMAAQLLVTFSSGISALVASRLLLGIGTGPATAVTQHACFKWFNPKERMLPSSLIYSSIMLGGLIGAAILPYAIEHLGWRLAYFCLAVAGLIWLCLWLAFGREGSQQLHGDRAENGAETKIPYKALLLNRTFVCITLLAFFCYVPSALGVSWTVVYLKKGLNLSTLQAGYYMLTVTVLAMITGLTVSSLAQKALKRGASLFWTMVAPPLMCSALGGLLFALIGISTDQPVLITALMGLGTALVNVLPSFSMTITSHFTPVQQRGSMLAIHNALQTSAGMLVPSLVGQLIAWKGNEIAQGFECAVCGFGMATLICALIGFRVVTPESTRIELQAMVVEPHLRWIRAH